MRRDRAATGREGRAAREAHLRATVDKRYGTREERRAARLAAGEAIIPREASRMQRAKVRADVTVPQGDLHTCGDGDLDCRGCAARARAEGYGAGMALVAFGHRRDVELFVQAASDLEAPDYLAGLADALRDNPQRVSWFRRVRRAWRLALARRLAPFHAPVTFDLDLGEFNLSVTRGPGEVDLHT